MANLKYILKDIEMFSSLEDNVIDEIISISKIKNYLKDSIIFYENDENKFLYFLIKGNVKLYKIDKYNNEIFLNNIEDNSFIYLSMYDKSANYAFYTASTIQDSKILIIDLKVFEEKILSKHTILLKKILKEYSKHINLYQDIINRDLIYDTNAKVAKFICKNLKNFNTMKKIDIAYNLHIQPETLSRTIKKFVNLGLIKLDGKNVTILNKEALENLYK
jgi:CRP/FNR family transcriptional regulator